MKTAECLWRDDGEYWETSCDNAWVFTVDGPVENNVKFCPFCGKELKVTRGKLKRVA